jgi:hypothetical protein
MATAKLGGALIKTVLVWASRQRNSIRVLNHIGEDRRNLVQPLLKLLRRRTPFLGLIIRHRSASPRLI